jgi:hypothetical protein
MNASNVNLEGSKLQQQDRPREKIELLIDDCWDLYGKAYMSWILNHRRCREWEQLLTTYGNIRARTLDLVEENEKDNLKENQAEIVTLETISGYLRKLQKNGLYKVGQDEVILSE